MKEREIQTTYRTEVVPIWQEKFALTAKRRRPTLSARRMAATPAAQAVSKLLAHARAAGAELHEKVVVKEGQRGRGLFAAAPIAKGALLLSVPLSHAVVPAGPLADLVPTRCSRLLALALTVLHEIHVKSPRDPFFEMLAASPLPPTPSLWTHDAIAELEGTSLLPNRADAAAAGGHDSYACRLLSINLHTHTSGTRPSKS